MVSQSVSRGNPYKKNRFNPTNSVKGHAQVVNHPLVFKAEKYNLWKLKMIEYLEDVNIDLLDIIKLDFFLVG